MTFKMKYPITKDYLQKGKRRSGIKMPKVSFVVLHDVGNDGVDSNKNGVKEGTTAKNNIKYYRNTPTVSASAHTFIDHTGIYECIPLTTGTPEKAWHVIYNKPQDNKLFGADSNDVGAGVELCYFPEFKDRSLEAYKRYIWYVAYVCYKFGIDPTKKLAGHEELDPGRKTDPSNGLKYIGKTLAQCKKDIIAEYNECLGKKVTATTTSTSKPSTSTSKEFKVKVKVDSLNYRSGAGVSFPVKGTIKKNEIYTIVETKNGWGKLKSGAGWINVSSTYVTKL